MHLTIAPESPLSGIHVLFFDADPTERDRLARELARLGAEVTAVGEVSDALAAFYGFGADVVLSEARRSGRDGFALVEAIRLGPPDGRDLVPAVALVDAATPEAHAEALAWGFQACLARPCHVADLTEAISVVEPLVAMYRKLESRIGPDYANLRDLYARLRARQSELRADAEPTGAAWHEDPHPEASGCRRLVSANCGPFMITVVDAPEEGVVWSVAERGGDGAEVEGAAESVSAAQLAAVDEARRRVEARREALDDLESQIGVGRRVEDDVAQVPVDAADRVAVECEALYWYEVARRETALGPVRVVAAHVGPFTLVVHTEASGEARWGVSCPSGNLDDAEHRVASEIAGRACAEAYLEELLAECRDGLVALGRSTQHGPMSSSRARDEGGPRGRGRKAS